MKRFLQISAAQREIGEELFDRLAKVVPGEYYAIFRVRLRDDSAECEEVLRLLRDAGYAPGSDYEPRKPGQFSCWPNYEYEPSDFDRASYFQMIPHKGVEKFRARCPDGVLELDAKGLKRKGLLAVTDPLALLVSSEFRADLEAAGFIGLGFRPTRATRVDSRNAVIEVPWSRVGCEPYWEIAPTVRLPRISRRCRLVDPHGQPITGEDSSRGTALLEGEFPAGELHYRRAEIGAVEPFDFASTRERFAYGHGPQTVLSRRVYDFVNARRLKCLWLPVYVDEE